MDRCVQSVCSWDVLMGSKFGEVSKHAAGAFFAQTNLR